MPWMGFEPTISAFERAKTVHALDRASTELLQICINDVGRFEWVEDRTHVSRIAAEEQQKRAVTCSLSV
jgi:hypothetical protein